MFEWFISFRYLRARHKQKFISLISLISVAGITMGVMALIVVLAVYSGFTNGLRDQILGINDGFHLLGAATAFTRRAWVVHRTAMQDSARLLLLDPQDDPARVVAQLVLRHPLPVSQYASLSRDKMLINLGFDVVPAFERFDAFALLRDVSSVTAVVPLTAGGLEAPAPGLEPEPASI